MSHPIKTIGNVNCTLQFHHVPEKGSRCVKGHGGMHTEDGKMDVSLILGSLLSKMEIFLGQHFHEGPLWQKDILTSPFEKGDQRGIFK